MNHLIELSEVSYDDPVFGELVCGSVGSVPARVSAKYVHVLATCCLHKSKKSACRLTDIEILDNISASYHASLHALKCKLPMGSTIHGIRLHY